MDSSAVQEIANQIGVAVENVIPAYAQMHIMGDKIVLWGSVIVIAIGIICGLIGYIRYMKYDEGFGFGLVAIFLIAFCFLILIFCAYSIYMWSTYPDMMFLHECFTSN